MAKIKHLLTNLFPKLLKYKTAHRMPFMYDKLNIYNPETAWINITDNCNMQCVMCNQWRETKTNELNTSEWKHIIDQLSDLKIRSLGIGGGEPLLFKELDQVIIHAKKKGISVGITTSAFTLTERRLEELINAGLDAISISIEGIESKYEKIRGRSWQNVLRAIELVSEANEKKKLKARISYVLMKDTIENFNEVFNLAKQKNLPLNIHPLDISTYFFKIEDNAERWFKTEDKEHFTGLIEEIKNIKRNSPTKIINRLSDIDFFKDYYDDPVQKDIPCVASQLRIMISGSGDVNGGCLSLGTFGNLREQTLGEIVRSKKYQDFHKQMFFKDCPGCSCGYDANNYYSFKMQLRELGLRFRGNNKIQQKNSPKKASI